jgi:hypothetical protein
MDSRACDGIIPMGFGSWRLMGSCLLVIFDGGNGLNNIRYMDVSDHH